MLSSIPAEPRPKVDDTALHNLEVLRGRELLQVCVGRFDSILNFDEQVSAVVVGAFQLGDSGSATDFPKATVGLLACIGSAVANAEMEEGGRARIDFTNGTTLRFLHALKASESCPIVAGPLR